MENNIYKEHDELNQKAIKYGVMLAAVFGFVKIGIGIYSGSLGVISSSVDSFIDFLIELMNFIFIKKASSPRDEIYNYGLGKLEAISSIINGVLLFFGGVYVAYLSFDRFRNNEQVNIDLDLSLPVMFVVSISVLLFTIYLKKVYEKTNNIIIFANYSHYKVDVVMNLGVFISLILVYITKNNDIDLIVGFLISGYIIYSSYNVAKNGFDEILDKVLNEEITSKILEIIKSKKDIYSYHELRTRKSGAYYYVDLHIVFKDSNISLHDAHTTGDEIEYEIAEIDKSKKWIITLHLDPEDDLHLKQK